jgi:hypothetical protein
MVPDEEAQITVQMLNSFPGPCVDNVDALVAIVKSLLGRHDKGAYLSLRLTLNVEGTARMIGFCTPNFA